MIIKIGLDNGKFTHFTVIDIYTQLYVLLQLINDEVQKCSWFNKQDVEFNNYYYRLPEVLVLVIIYVSIR